MKVKYMLIRTGLLSLLSFASIQCKPNPKALDNTDQMEVQLDTLNFSQLDSLNLKEEQNPIEVDSVCIKQSGHVIDDFIFPLEEESLWTPTGNHDNITRLMKVASKYRPRIVTLLQCENLSSTHKLILVQILNGLSLEDYISTCNELYSLYSNNRIEFGVIENLVFNYRYDDPKLIKHYTNPKVIRFFNLIKKDTSFYDNNKDLLGIDEILSGEDWKQTEEIIKGGGS